MPCGETPHSDGDIEHKAQLKLIRTGGLPGFWYAATLFGSFWCVLGPRGSVWPDFPFVNATLTRRIDPHSPEASANLFIFRTYVSVCSTVIKFGNMKIPYTQQS